MTLRATTWQTVGPFFKIGLAWLYREDLAGANVPGEHIEITGRVLDGDIVKVPLRDLRYDLRGFIQTLKLKPKLLFLCNPNNPTGNYFTHAELESLLEKAREEEESPGLLN